MAKTYFNHAVIGNSRMLGCITDRGELTRLFWPNIDFMQQIDNFYTGVFVCDWRDSTSWFHEDSFKCNQSYAKDTNILITDFISDEKFIKVKQIDFILPGKDILIRHYELENIGPYEADMGFMLYSSAITTIPHMSGIMFDDKNEALVHYRHDHYLSISAGKEAYSYQLGGNAGEAARSTILSCHDRVGMMPDGAASWQLGIFKPGDKKSIALRICLAPTLKEVRKMANDANLIDVYEAYRETESYWHSYLLNAKNVCTGSEVLDSVYRRSLLVFKLMSDERTGGLLAAPEIDEDFSRCGRYAYCWGRDAAFITGALDKAGLYDTVERFYEWAINVQDEEGSWQQRYHMDGNLAPSWGLQVDETGTLVWGMLEHFKMTASEAFLHKVWPSVCKAVSFLIEFIDPETGLPAPSFDLWEERFGEHTYSAAAVAGGIKAAIEMAGYVGAPMSLIEKWIQAQDSLRSAMEKWLWKEEKGSFLRSIRVKLNPWGSEYSQDKVFIKVNKGCIRDVTLEDSTVDISLLGVNVPFEVFDAKDSRVVKTVELIEKNLWSEGLGGIRRYENDNYIGGNPWILATLWVALYHIRTGNTEKAREYLSWSVRGRTSLDLLPEQVGKSDGKPAWVIPLTWSHAMFVMVLMELVENGEVFDGN